MARCSGLRTVVGRGATILSVVLLPLALLSLAGPTASGLARSRAVLPHWTLSPNAIGGLDCNGYSPIQKSVIPANACTDVKGVLGVDNSNTWGGRFYDNGHYIGHDEPDMTFFSNTKGSGDNVRWSETLPVDPSSAPTVSTPGSDVTHWAELSTAPWFGLDLCDGSSYPQLPCTPHSDANAPSCSGVACPANAYPGAGSAFLEMQFYPPGEAPFVDNISCDNTHWCASLHINELMCTLNFVSCNPNCEETTNFAFLQRNGIPTGPPSPQALDQQSATPNSKTLLMNPGDQLKIHIWDAPAPAVPADGIPSGHALEVSVHDLTTGQVGYMQASAANGFAQTNMNSCNGSYFNFEPEYSTSKVGNIVPWASLAANVSTEFEIGHFEPCTSVSNQIGSGAGGPSDPIYSSCTSPYESVADSSSGESPGEAFCYPTGDTHGSLASDPNIVGGCEDNLFVNGDLDFDGTPYYPDWPTSASVNQSTTTVPSSFVQSMPSSAGHRYPEFMFQTDTAQSESGCALATLSACTVPPQGPEVAQAGNSSFYPFWSVADNSGTCSIEFGNVTQGVNDFGGDKQYGSVQFATLGYPEFEGAVYANTCPATVSQGYELLGQSGTLVAGGNAPSFPTIHNPAAPVVSVAATPSGKGYVAVSDKGVVFTGGDGTFYGDLATRGFSDVVGIAETPSGNGYWLVRRNGAVSHFGKAGFFGSLWGKGIHTHLVVALVPSPTGKGYLIVTSNGKVYALGDAKSYGSISSSISDIVSLLPSPTGSGYTLVGANGAIYPFGTSPPKFGSLPGRHIKLADIVGAALSYDGGGYWMVTAKGTVFAFGDAGRLAHNLTSADLPLTAIAQVSTNYADVGP